MTPPEESTLREEIVDLVEKHFPKGECKERGQAIVLVAEIKMFYDQLIQERERLARVNESIFYDTPIGSELIKIGNRRFVGRYYDQDGHVQSVEEPTPQEAIQKLKYQYETDIGLHAIAKARNKVKKQAPKNNPSKQAAKGDK